MKKQVTQTPHKLVFMGLIASCLTIFATVQRQPVPLSQAETLHAQRAPASLDKTCVLFYEREEHPAFAKLKKQYKDHPEFILVPVAKPSDIVKCVMDHNPKEVMIMAHTHKVNASTTQLTYFYPLTEDETIQNYSRILKDLKNQHKKIVSHKNFSFCNTHPKSHVTCTTSQKKEMRLRNAIAKIQVMKKEDPKFRLIFGYKRGLVGQKHFDNLYSLVKTSALNLKKIRLMSGHSKKIAQSYSGLMRLSQEQGIKIQKAQKSQMVALNGNRHFSSLGSKWLAENEQGE